MSISEEIKRIGEVRKLLFTEGGQTNAEHIRSMTDEELAEWLEEVDCWNCDCCVYQRECRLEYDEEKHDCADGRMKWLKQPYKEDA